jgi:class 3 adenylate cyclase
VLLIEAMVAVALSRSWHASWWEWHVLMLIAFVVVAWTARAQWREERFADLYLEDTAAGRREVSVLFADMEGFTSFSERHDPREVAEMLNALFAVAVPAVVREHGGEVEQIIGDAIMATFNTRRHQPDHALRAARAALSLRDAAAAVAREHPEWPRLRIGVNTGEVIVGIVGTSGGRKYTIVGDAVNVASRLEQSAPVGGVVVGAQTAKQVPGARLEPLGALTVKGKSDPVEAYLLTGLE